MSGLLQPHHARDCAREPLPICGFLLQLLPSHASERVELGSPIVFGRFPLGCDPAFLLQFVQRRIEGAVADLENVSRNLLQALPDGPAMQRFERQYLQKQQIQGPLDKIGWFAHSRLHSVTEKHTTTPLGKQEECLKEYLKCLQGGLRNGKRQRPLMFLVACKIARQPEVLPVLCCQWTLGINKPVQICSH